LMQGILPTFHFGIKSFTENNANPDIERTKNQSIHIMNGILIVHLFCMWDSYFENSDIQTYFRPEEKKRFYAFKHIRIVAAHNINGNRKGNRPSQDRMNHAEKLDEIMTSEKPIDGVVLEHYKMDLSNSNAALECRQFMQNMAMLLAGGRISVGGPYGQVRNSSGGLSDIM